MNRACFTKNTNLHEQNQHASSIRPLKNNFVRMKSTYYLITFFFVLFSFNSYAQNNAITITNLANGQEVSGSFIVKLDTVNITDYRIASYYMDNKFISNVNEAPFTFEFDSRDFENGKHELSVKVLLKNGIVEIDKVKININNAQPAYNLVVKNIKRYA